MHPEPGVLIVSRHFMPNFTQDLSYDTLAAIDLLCALKFPKNPSSKPLIRDSDTPMFKDSGQTALFTAVPLLHV